MKRLDYVADSHERRRLHAFKCDFKQFYLWQCIAMNATVKKIAIVAKLAANGTV